MQENLEAKVDNPFESVDAQVKAFFKQCAEIDGSSRFVEELNKFMPDVISRATQVKDLVELLRGRFWLKFIQETRNVDFNKGELILDLKNKLMQQCEIVNERINKNVSERTSHRSGTTMGRTDDKERYAY